MKFRKFRSEVEGKLHGHGFTKQELEDSDNYHEWLQEYYDEGFSPEQAIKALLIDFQVSA